MSAILAIPQASSTAPLSPAQRKFNQLQQQIDKARQRLRDWDEALPAFHAAHAEQVSPLRQEAEGLRRSLAERLDGWLTDGAWPRGERQVLEQVVCSLAREVLEDHALPEPEQAHWKALHDRHAPLAFDAQNAQELEVLKRMFEHQTGVDLGDAEPTSEDDLLQQVREKLLEQQAQEPPAPPPRKPSAAQQRRAAEREAVEQQARQSLREVFRKLASSLHPDRANSEADAARRTALMQRANAAYAQEDLLALLALQLEIEQIDAAHLLRASDAQLRHFNAILQEQLDELRAELGGRERRFCADYLLQGGATVNPTQLGRLLRQAQADWRGQVFEAGRDLQAVQTRDSTRRWVKRLRQCAPLW